MLLSKSFYLNDDVVQVAKELLGKKLISEIGNETTSGIIVETEAYRAPDDLACHAKGNTKTPRTISMFNEGGHSYIYICYGIHHLFNVVSGPREMAHVILIRGLEPVEGINSMLSRRNCKELKTDLTNGPGKFTKAMNITTRNNEVKLYDKNSQIQIHDSDYRVESIVSGPRVGMSHRTKECGHWPWRFRIANNKWTSKPNLVNYDW